MSNHESSDTSNVEMTRELFSRLIDEKKLLFYKIIHLLTLNRHDADEIFQESMLAGWENRFQLRDSRRFVPWMIKIVRSMSAKHIRTQKKDRKIWHALFQSEQETSPLRALKHNPEENMINDEERVVAMDAYDRLPDTERIIYGLYHSESFSQAAIAEMLDMPEGTVRNHLHRAQRRLDKRMRAIVVAFLAERLNEGDPSALVQQVVEKIYAMPISAEAGIAATGAAGAAAKSGFSLSGFLQAFALPFLWVTSLFISGMVGGTAFVRNMPTLSSRRWLIKHLSFCYLGMVILPLSFLMANWIIRSGFVGFQCREPIFAVFSCLCFIGASIYVFCLNRKYNKVFLGHATDIFHDTTDHYARFKRTVNSGLWIVFVFISLFWLFLLFADIICNVSRDGFVWLSKAERLPSVLLVFSFGVVSFVFHFAVSRMFQYFADISKDETAFQTSRLVDRSESSKKADAFREIIFLLPFLCFLPGANIMHLIGTRARIAASVAELILFSVLWLFVCVQNIKHPQSRWKNIWTMFLVQFIIFQILHYFIYD